MARVSAESSSAEPRPHVKLSKRHCAADPMLMTAHPTRTTPTAQLRLLTGTNAEQAHSLQLTRWHQAQSVSQSVRFDIRSTASGVQAHRRVGAQTTLYRIDDTPDTNRAWHTVYFKM
jgi:hypothetical protein